MIRRPGAPERFLGGLGARPEFRDAVLGDLAEEFALRAERDGPVVARRWYYREAIRSIPHLLRDWWRRSGPRDVTYLAGVVVTSYVFVAMIAVIVTLTVRSVTLSLGAPRGVRLLPPDPPLLGLLWLALGFATTTLGGAIAAWLGRRAPLLSALALAAVWSSISVGASAASGDSPIWYRLAVPVVVLVGTVTGGILRIRGSNPVPDAG